MTTSQIALGLAHLSASETADKLEAVGHAMTNNPAFQAPPITPIALVARGGSIRAALKAKADADVAAKLATAKLRAEIKAGNEELTAQSHYVAAQTKGDDALVKSAGLALKAKAVHSHTIATPTGVSGALGDHPHEVRVHWHGRASQKGGGNSVHEFHVEMTADPSKVDSWTLAGSTTTSTLVVDNLPTGAHSFRVIAVGADHVSAPSGVVTIYVP